MVGSGLSTVYFGKTKVHVTMYYIINLLSDDVFQIILYPNPNRFKYHKEKRWKTCPKTTRINNRDVAIKIKEGYPWNLYKTL